jgi:hypothetical protein
MIIIKLTLHSVFISIEKNSIFVLKWYEIIKKFQFPNYWIKEKKRKKRIYFIIEIIKWICSILTKQQQQQQDILNIQQKL